MFNLKKTGIQLIVCVLILLVISTHIYAQNDEKQLTLYETIQIANKQSPDALLAKHGFRASYWQHRSYKASYLPAMVLQGYFPDFNRTIDKYYTSEGSEFYYRSESSIYAGLSVNQKIGFTGGTVSLNSNLTQLSNFIQDSVSYRSDFFNITYQQPIFQYNPYKWERKIEPLKYTEAKKKYLEEMEEVSLTATNHFFNLLLAQIREKIAIINAANYDTLYKIAIGRFNLGKIAENDLLQLELQYLRASAEVDDTKLEVDNQMFNFKSYLRITDETKITLISPSYIDPFLVNAVTALEKARENSSEAISFSRRLIEAKSEVAKAKMDGRFDAELFAVFGFTNDGEFIKDLKNPVDNQQVRLGITMPIFDWGVARGNIKIAQSNQEIVRTTVEQEQIDFDQEIFLKVARFNMQYNQVLIAAKSDTVAQKGYDITKERYLIGKISITDLNIAQKEADNSKSNYYSALWTYWRSYYEIRRLTLFDFEMNLPIMVDYKNLL